jgi:hypothetical protein
VGREEAAENFAARATGRSAVELLHARRAAGSCISTIPSTSSRPATPWRSRSSGQQVFRLIHTNGTKPADGIEFWMGDSRGRWEGDTLVVNVTNHNDRTWLDAAGNFHSER